MRKSFFNAENTGYFKTEKRESNAKNPMTGILRTVFNLSKENYMCMILLNDNLCPYAHSILILKGNL